MVELMQKRHHSNLICVFLGIMITNARLKGKNLKPLKLQIR